MTLQTTRSIEGFMRQMKSDRTKENNLTPGLLDGIPVIEDADQFQQMVNSLPEEQKKYCTLATQFAKLWEYFSNQNIPIPADIVAAMRDLPNLSSDEKLELLEVINAELLAFESNASKNPGFRQ